MTKPRSSFGTVLSIFALFGAMFDFKLAAAQHRYQSQQQRGGTRARKPRNRFQALPRGCRPPARRHYQTLPGGVLPMDRPKRLRDLRLWLKVHARSF